MHTPQRHVLKCRRSQRHTQCVASPLWQASPCLSVWHGVGRGARALCATLDQRLPLHVQHTTHPGEQDSHTHLHLPLLRTSISCYLFLLCASRPLSLFLSPRRCVRLCVCSCRLIGDALCAICSNPPIHLPPFPLITRVGLTICVPVCSHSEKRGTFGGGASCGGGGNGGCHNRHTHEEAKQQTVMYVDKNEELTCDCPAT